MRAAGGLCGALLTKVWCFFNTPTQEKQPPSKRARPRPNYTEEELDDLRAAKELKVKWQLRGPPPGVLPEGATWRGQRYRPESGKWANRGGSLAPWYTAYYAAKKKGPEHEQAFLEKYPHPKKR